MSETAADRASASERAFGRAQRWLPQHALSRAMHRLARSRSQSLRNLLIRTVLRWYPQIDMTEAEHADPYAYPSFNAFFTRALRAGARPLPADPSAVVSPVDGTVSQAGRITAGQLVQAKGHTYSCEALLADDAAARAYHGGSYACLYLAPYNYHRIHMPLDATLRATRYVPGTLFGVNAATARVIPGLFARNERVICEFDSDAGPLAIVMVGALFVGSIETVYAGEINPPPVRGGDVRTISLGSGTRFARGAEIGRFNMGSTVVLLFGREQRFASGVREGAVVRMGDTLSNPVQGP